jgi:hypothetical protein
LVGAGESTTNQNGVATSFEAAITFFASACLSSLSIISYKKTIIFATDDGCARPEDGAILYLFLLQQCLSTQAKK